MSEGYMMIEYKGKRYAVKLREIKVPNNNPIKQLLYNKKFKNTFSSRNIKSAPIILKKVAWDTKTGYTSKPLQK